jgi:hypothetical protein
MGFDGGAVTILTESKKYLAMVPKNISVCNKMPPPSSPAPSSNETQVEKNTGGGQAA